MNIEQARHYLRLRSMQQARQTQEEGNTDPENIPDCIATETILDELSRLHYAVSAQEAELRTLREIAKPTIDAKKQRPANAQGARNEPRTTRSTTGKRK